VSAQDVFAQLLAVGGAPVQLAALAWVVFRVEQLHRDAEALKQRVKKLEEATA
jgi:ubiquinone biosynthesis protein UbiJ